MRDFTTGVNPFGALGLTAVVPQHARVCRFRRGCLERARFVATDALRGKSLSCRYYRPVTLWVRFLCRAAGSNLEIDDAVFIGSNPAQMSEKSSLCLRRSRSALDLRRTFRHCGPAEDSDFGQAGWALSIVFVRMADQAEVREDFACSGNQSRKCLRCSYRSLTVDIDCSIRRI
jgi:hypothetical protein